MAAEFSNKGQSCDSCDFPTETTPFPRSPYYGGGDVELCRVCYSTNFSKAILYPGQGDSSLYRSVAYGFNMVLAEVVSLRKEVQELRKEVNGETA